MVFTLSLLFRNRGGSTGRLPVPMFVVFFCVFVAINSYGLIPEGLRLFLVEVSALVPGGGDRGAGGQDLAQVLAEVGTVPIVMMVSETVFLAAWIIGGTWVLGLG